MLRFFSLIIALALAAPAFAEDKVETKIRGKRYATGLLQRAGGMAADTPVRAPKPAEYDGMPDAYDSDAEGYTTRIKNQGSCGSCYAFSRAGAFESYLIRAGKATKSELDLSEQDIIVNDKGSYGCSGGFMDGRFEVEKGVTTEALCPYKATTRWQSCKGAKFAKAPKWVMLGGFNRAPSAEELAWAIWQKKSLAVTVAAGTYFDPNAAGEITRCGSRSINHMVQLTAYKKQPDGSYLFKIKNSWGTGWGKVGYGWSKQGCNRLASTAGSALYYDDK